MIPKFEKKSNQRIYKIKKNPLVKIAVTYKLRALWDLHLIYVYTMSRVHSPGEREVFFMENTFFSFIRNLCEKVSTDKLEFTAHKFQ